MVLQNGFADELTEEGGFATKEWRNWTETHSGREKYVRYKLGFRAHKAGG
jgi:hypothetical protein